MRNFPKLLSLLGVLLLFGTASAQWQVDPYHSTVAFTVRHLGITKVNGNFGQFTGTVKADEQTGRVSEVEGTVQVASVNTGVEKRDTHLRSADFFDAAKFPTMTAKTRSITWKGDQLTAQVDLTIKGVTKTIEATGEMTGPQKINMGQGDQLRSGYSIRAKISRKDFGIVYGALVEGLAVVSDNVDISLEGEIYKTLGK